MGVLFLEFGCPKVVEIGFTTCGVRFARLRDRREAGPRQQCDSGVGEQGRRFAQLCDLRRELERNALRASWGSRGRAARGRAATRLVQFDSKGEAETVALRASWDPGGELEWAVVQSPVVENATAM